MGFKIIAIINVVVFLLYGLDKYLAIKNKRRIPEKYMLLSAFFLGSAGAFLGMIIFKHKISKSSFLWKFAGIIVAQILIYYLMMSSLWK